VGLWQKGPDAVAVNAFQGVLGLRRCTQKICSCHFLPIPPSHWAGPPVHRRFNTTAARTLLPTQSDPCESGLLVLHLDLDLLPVVADNSAGPWACVSASMAGDGNAETHGRACSDAEHRAHGAGQNPISTRLNQRFANMQEPTKRGTRPGFWYNTTVSDTLEYGGDGLPRQYMGENTANRIPGFPIVSAGAEMRAPEGTKG